MQQIFARYGWLSAFLICLVASAVDAQRPAIPEVPGLTCADGDDNDNDGLRDSADPDCAAAAAFSLVSGAYRAEVENFRISGPWTTVTDSTASPTGGSGAYVVLPPSTRMTSGQIAGTGIAAGEYKVRMKVHLPTEESTRILLKAGPTPFPGAPDTSDGAILNNGQPTASWTWVTVGRVDTPQNWRDGLNGTPTRALTVASGDALWILTKPDVRIDCLDLVPVTSTAVPDCPGGGSAGGGGGGGGTEDPTTQYSLLKLTGAELAIGSADWGKANVVSLTGYHTDPLATGVKLQAIWKDGGAGSDRIGVRLEQTLPGLTWSATTHDSTTIVNDTAVIMRLKIADLIRALNINAWLLMGNPQPVHTDANYGGSGGTRDYTPDLANAVVTTSVSGDTRAILIWFDAPHALADGQQFLCEYTAQERDANGVRYRRAFSTNATTGDTISEWGVCEASATALPVSADTTPPSVGALSFSNVGQNGLSVSFTASDAESGISACRLRWDTNPADNAVADSLSPVSGTYTGGRCQFNVSGLEPSTTYEWKGTATNGVNLSTHTAVADQATAAPPPPPAAGPGFYVSANGSGTTCSSAAPCSYKRLFSRTEPAPSPGETWIIKSGQYPTFERINCASNANNGTASARITLKAEVERMAHIKATHWKIQPFVMVNCEYWTIEGLHIEGMDLGPANDNPSGSVVVFDSTETTHHIIFRRNLVRFNNRLRNGAIVSTGMSDSLFEHNEMYSYHRNGMGNGTRMVFRGNYMNSRQRADHPDCPKTDSSGCDSSNSHSHGDSAYLCYPCSNNLFEDNISEGNSAGFEARWGYGRNLVNNRIFGLISLNDVWSGVQFSKVPDSNNYADNNRFEHCLAVNPRFTGFRFTNARNNISRFLTAVGGPQASDEHGFLWEVRRYAVTVPPHSFDGENMLARGNSAAGFSVGGGHTAASRIDGMSSVGNGTNYSPASSGHWGSPKLTTDPGFTNNSPVCIPTGSSLRTAGVGGAQIGADVTKRFIDGVRTTQNRWTQTKPANCPTSNSGWYPVGAGACIAGVNDTPSTSYYNVADRLNITTAVLNNCEADGVY